MEEEMFRSDMLFFWVRKEGYVNGYVGFEVWVYSITYLVES